ncbi:group II intron maturase-specific domain-containing protein [Mesorhizobium sp. ZC-5]
MIKELKPYLIGWGGYFGFCQTPRVLTHLEAWIRRRSTHVSLAAVGERAQPLQGTTSSWRTKVRLRLPPVHRRDSGACQDTRRSNKLCATITSSLTVSLDFMSLPKLNPIEPPWYGPVCPVVWDGRRREASPYPDRIPNP